MNEVKSLEECRACLKKIEDGVSQELFQPWNTSWAIPGAQIADDFRRLTNIEISKLDKHSKVICLQCHCRLADACSFSIMAQTVDGVLKNRSKNPTTAGNTTDVESSWPQPILVNKNINGNFENSIEVEVKQEVLSDEEYSLNHTGHDWEPTMDIKIEPEEIIAPVSSSIQVNDAYSLKDTNEEAVHLNGTNNYLEEYLECTMKEEPTTSDEQETAPDLPLDCMLCMKAFNSVTGLKAHVIAQHSYGTVKRNLDADTDDPSPLLKEMTNQFVCATCREGFATRTDLMVHEAEHGMHVCFVCGAKYNTFRQLSRHGARCRPRIAPAGGPARLPIRLQQLDQSNNKPSVVEDKVGRGRKRSKAGRFIESTKVVPPIRTYSRKDVTTLTATKVDPVQTESKKELSNKEPIVERVKNQFENEAAIVEMQAAPVNTISDNDTSIEHTEIDLLEKNGSLIEETKVIPFQIQAKNGGSIEDIEVAPIIKNSENKPLTEQTEENPGENESKSEGHNMGTIIDESKVTLVEKQIKTEPTVEEFEDLLQEELTNKPSTEEMEIEVFQEQTQNEPSIDFHKIECKGELQTSQLMIIDTVEQAKITIPAPGLTTCNALLTYQIPNEDESSDTGTKRENVDEITLQSPVDSSKASQDGLEIIPTNTRKEPEPTEPNHRLPTESTEHESLQQPDQENSSSNQLDDNNTNSPEETISNVNEIGQSMKVHLAINPLSQDPIVLENKMDNENVTENSGCESK